MHESYTEIIVSGGTVKPGDFMVWVRKDYSSAHPGSECAQAMTLSHSNAGDVAPDGSGWDGTLQDHGGRVYAASETSSTGVTAISIKAGLVLIGGIDTPNPLADTGVPDSDTGTYYLCYAQKPSGWPDGYLWTPTVANFVFLDHIVVHVHHFPPSVPPSPPPSPPPLSPPLWNPPSPPQSPEAATWTNPVSRVAQLVSSGPGNTDNAGAVGAAVAGALVALLVLTYLWRRGVCGGACTKPPTCTWRAAYAELSRRLYALHFERYIDEYEGIYELAPNERRGAHGTVAVDLPRLKTMMKASKKMKSARKSPEEAGEAYSK